jgi:hypothetical protein
VVVIRENPERIVLGTLRGQCARGLGSLGGVEGDPCGSSNANVCPRSRPDKYGTRGTPGHWKGGGSRVPRVLLALVLRR